MNSKPTIVEENAEEKTAKPSTAYSPSLMALGRGINGTHRPREVASMWLVTFTDMRALMLTFFVLLYAMSIPKEDEWSQLTGAVQRQFATFSSQAFYAGAQDTIEIEKLDYSRALDLGYLK